MYSPVSIRKSDLFQPEAPVLSSSQLQLRSAAGQRGSMAIVAIIGGVIVLALLYVGHQLMTCYRFAQFQNTLRTYIDMDTPIDDVLKEKHIRAYVSPKDSGVQLIRAVRGLMERGDFEGVRKRLRPITSTDTDSAGRINGSLDLLEDSRERLAELEGNWKSLVQTRRTEGDEYKGIREETAALLSAKLTKDELPYELIEVDVVNTGPLPFYQAGEIEGLPIVQGIADGMDKALLISSLAATYQKSLDLVGKKEAGDPAAKFRHLQVKARHLRRRNQDTAQKLEETHRQMIDLRVKARDARSSVQGVLYILLENRKRPELASWVPSLYESIRHHARKFGHLIPAVETAPAA